MKFEIKHLPETKLYGEFVEMSLTNNKTHELWKGFIQKLKSENLKPAEKYSVAIYPEDYYQNFSPNTVFEKGACIKDIKPHNDSKEIILEGKYVVFTYKGKASNAAPFFQKIFGETIPQNDLVIDDRPHFELLTDKYLGEHPDSEEEVWIPVK